MRKFNLRLNMGEVDLDDLKTYEYLPDDAKQLDDLMFKEIGMALVYMDYFHPEAFPKKKKFKNNPYTNKKELDCGYAQRLRVYALIEKFSEERKNHYNDILWLKEQVFLFQEEIENMC